jgi:hypothetical protein
MSLSVPLLAARANRRHRLEVATLYWREVTPVELFARIHEALNWHGASQKPDGSLCKGTYDEVFEDAGLTMPPVAPPGGWSMTPRPQPMLCENYHRRLADQGRESSQTQLLQELIGHMEPSEANDYRLAHLPKASDFFCEAHPDSIAEMWTQQQQGLDDCVSFGTAEMQGFFQEDDDPTHIHCGGQGLGEVKLNIVMETQGETTWRIIVTCDGDTSASAVQSAVQAAFNDACRDVNRPSSRIAMHTFGCATARELSGFGRLEAFMVELLRGGQDTADKEEEDEEVKRGSTTHPTDLPVAHGPVQPEQGSGATLTSTPWASATATGLIRRGKARTNATEQFSKQIAAPAGELTAATVTGWSSSLLLTSLMPTSTAQDFYDLSWRGSEGILLNFLLSALRTHARGFYKGVRPTHLGAAAGLGFFLTQYRTCTKIERALHKLFARATMASKRGLGTMLQARIQGVRHDRRIYYRSSVQTASRVAALLWAQRVARESKEWLVSIMKIQQLERRLVSRRRFNRSVPRSEGELRDITQHALILRIANLLRGANAWQADTHHQQEGGYMQGAPIRYSAFLPISSTMLLHRHALPHTQLLTVAFLYSELTSISISAPQSTYIKRYSMRGFQFFLPS